MQRKFEPAIPLKPNPLRLVRSPSAAPAPASDHSAPSERKASTPLRSYGQRQQFPSTRGECGGPAPAPSSATATAVPLTPRERTDQRPSRVPPACALILAVAFSLYAYALLPRGLEAERLLAAQDDPAALADQALTK